MAGARALLRAAQKSTKGKKGIPQTGGFNLDKPEPQHFKDATMFRKALAVQKDAVVPLDCREIGHRGLWRVGINGEVEGTDYRLSQAAFGDLCNFSQIPTNFIKKLAKSDEGLALDVIQSMLESTFHRGAKKAMVVDTLSKRVEGIVGMDTYSPLANIDVLDYALCADEAGLTFTNGWLQGPRMRVTIVNDLKPVQPRKDDIVKLGTNIESAINGDLSVRLATYCERLVCTNGMICREAGYAEAIRHQGDIQFNVQKGVVDCAAVANVFAPKMERAATQVIEDVTELTRILDFIGSPRNGGNETLKRAVIELAKDEAKAEGRELGELTVWNVVNGVTAAAHQLKSIQRKTEVEQLGYALMREFVSLN